jgi:anti-sigma B factor antagonist
LAFSLDIVVCAALQGGKGKGEGRGIHMELETAKEDEILFITPTAKRIDASTSTAFKGKMVDLIVQGEKLFILKMDKLEFIDSSGLGALISILKTLSNSKGNIALCGVNANIMNLFQVTRLDKVFPIFTNWQQGKEFLEKWKIKNG